MAADIGEDVIDVALQVADALTAVGAQYFVGGSLTTWAARLGIKDLLERAHG